MNESSSAEPQAPESSVLSRADSGFRAHLQGVGLHDLVMLQNLVRASGVFVVLSGDRTGTLHFSRGQLLHAETHELSGNAAALEILSWSEGEFINSERASREEPTVTASLESLLLDLATQSAAPRVDPPLSSATGVRRRMEGAEEFRTTRLGLGDPGAPLRAAAAPPGVGSPSGVFVAAPAGASVPAATSGVLPATSSPGTAEPIHGMTNVMLSPLGALVDANGIDADQLGAKAARIAQLTDLIGEAMGSGDTRSIKVRAAGIELLVRKHPDGRLSASLGPADPAADRTAASAAPPSARSS